MQTLVSKSKFAKMAGVNPSTVTRLCSTLLQAAVVGKQIDAAHPDAVKYLDKPARGPTSNSESAATGLDALYEDAVECCHRTGRWTASSIQRELRIGYERAKRIIDVIRINGLIPDKDAAPATTPDPVDSKPRGQAVVKQSKKSAALARAAAAAEDELGIGTVIHEVPEDIEAFADMTLRELIQRFGTDTAFVDWLKATKEIEYINEKRLKNAQTQGELVSRELVKVGIIEPIDAVHIKLLTDGAKTITRRVTAMHSAERDLDDIEKFVKDQITSFIRPVKAKVKRALKNA